MTTDEPNKNDLHQAQHSARSSSGGVWADFMGAVRRASLGWASANQLHRHILSGRGDVVALDFRIDQLQHQVTALQGFLEIAMKTTAEVNQFQSRLDNIERDIAALKVLLPSE